LHDGGSLKANNIDVDVIAERDGQILRGFVVDSLRDLSFAKEKYRLTISLTYVEKPFAIATDGNAKRVSLSYVANVVLKNHREEVVFTRPVSVHASSNISSAQGEAILSLYGRDNGALLKELGRRILESLKVFLSNES
jgi:hypothetical protein